MIRVYMDGIFDLFHEGHLDAIKQCSELGDHVIIGIVNDIDATDYKRKPIINEKMRCEMLKSCKYVDSIIFPAPLKINNEFILNHNIDLVVHAFADDNDFQKQKDFFKNINLHKINYSNKISTSEIINKIKNA